LRRPLRDVSHRFAHRVHFPHDRARRERRQDEEAREAADQGDSRAQYSLGALYVAGHGVPQDFVYAHMWFNLAASRAMGDDEKQYSAARDSLATKMTPQEIAEAHKFAREWQLKQSGGN